MRLTRGLSKSLRSLALLWSLAACEPSGRGSTASSEPAPLHERGRASAARPLEAPSASGSTPPSAAPSSAPTSAPPGSASASAPPAFTPIPPKRPGAFPGVEWKTVRAFVLEPLVEGRPTCLQVLAPDGGLCKTVKGPGVLLGEAQAKKLLTLLHSRASYGGGAKTFLPQHGFVFYDQAGAPVAEVAICLDCENVRGRPQLLPEEAYSHGLHKSAVSSLRALCRELALSHCDPP